MKDGIKGSIWFQLLRLLGAFIISWLFAVIIFSMLFPVAEDGALPEKYNFPMFGIAVILAIVVNMIIDYNTIQNLKSRILKSKADIVSVNEMSESLIDKASRVADKYLESETGVYEKFAEARKGATKIRNSSDFKMVVESYPELKANINTQKLLSQLESTENEILNAKVIYSSVVAKYNAKIHSFPAVLFRNVCKWEDVTMADSFTKDELVTDEALGI